MNDSNDIVYYCSNCLSLNIQIIGEICYCADCNSGHVSECSIKEWENKAIEKGINVIKNRKENGRN